MHGRLLGKGYKPRPEAIPLRGSIPCNAWAQGPRGAQPRPHVAIPLRGSIPCNPCLEQRRTQRNGEASQSPYGAQSLATPGLVWGISWPKEGVAIPLRGSIPCNDQGRIIGVRRLLASQSPYGAQSLATNLKGGESHGSLENVAIPLRGSIPCNTKEDVGEGDSLKGRNPLTGLNPLQRDTRSALGRAAQRSQSPYGAQSLATRRSSRGGGTSSLVAIPLRGSISCNL